MSLPREDPDLLFPVLWTFSVRSSVWTLAVHTAQVDRLALQVAFLPAHVARIWPRTVPRLMTEATALEACHRRASFFEWRHDDPASAKRHAV
jgi:hypothetical protein